MVRVAGTLQKSTDIMKSMGRLLHAPEVMQTMRTLGVEMTKVSNYLCIYIIIHNYIIILKFEYL